MSYRDDLEAANARAAAAEERERVARRLLDEIRKEKPLDPFLFLANAAFHESLFSTVCALFGAFAVGYLLACVL